MSDVVGNVEVEAAYVIRFGYEEFTLTKETAEDLFSTLGSLLYKE